MSEYIEPVDVAGETSRPHPLRTPLGILWQAWLAHGTTITRFIAIYFILGWVLEVFFHPGFILAYGVLLAVAAAVMLGGLDSSEGSEEFAFALPPTRHERYLVRALFGAALVVSLTGLGLVSISLDLPQLLWSLFVSSGFTEPFPSGEPMFLYAFAFSVPVCLYAVTFAIAATAITRGTVATSWILGGLATGALLGGASLLEGIFWNGDVNGWISTPVLVTSAALALRIGHRKYIWKEGLSRPAPFAGRSFGIGWVVLIIVILLFIFLGIATFPKGRSMKEAQLDKELRAMDVRMNESGEMPRSPHPSKEGE